jgi:protease II
MLVTSAVNDARVGYWEAVKWTLLVRAAQTAYSKQQQQQTQQQPQHVAANTINNNTSSTEYSSSDRTKAVAAAHEPNVLLRVSYDGGHQGAASSEEHFEQLAQELVFMIDTVGCDVGGQLWQHSSSSNTGSSDSTGTGTGTGSISSSSSDCSSKQVCSQQDSDRNRALPQ